MSNATLERLAARKPATGVAVVEPINYQSDDKPEVNRYYARFLKSKKSKKKIEVPLAECYGVANYKGPRKKFVVAIYKMEEGKRPVCLFVNEETMTAFHEYGGFPGNPDSISEYDGPLNDAFNN